MRNYHRFLLNLFLILVLIGVSGLTVALAQEGQPRLTITKAESETFPLITLNVIATDGQSQRVPNLGSLQVIEDGKPVADYDLGDATAGTDIYFVIDADANINARDVAGGLTRREKVRDSIVRYANDFMIDGQMDRVSIIVPEESGPVFIGNQGMIFSNEVLNAVNFYDTRGFSNPQLQAMIDLALDTAAEKLDEGHFQAILLFTDAGQLDQQLAFDAIVGKAQSFDIPIFVAILGAQADDFEIAGSSALSEPTRGTYLHMLEPAEADQIFRTFQANNTQFQISYESGLSSSGRHPVVVEANGIRSEAQLEIEVLPPVVDMVVDNTQAIRRVATDPDAPLTLAEPTSQPVTAQVSWPDAHPRTVVEAALEINGAPQPPVANPTVDDAGRITLPWDISSLDSGTYGVAMRVVDQLGLNGESDTMPMDIELEIPQAAVEESPVTATESEAVEPALESGGLVDSVGILGIVLGFFGLFIAILVLVFALVMIRRRGAEPKAAPAVAAAPGADMDHDATQVIMPAFVSRKGSGAFLEPLENAPEHPGNITLSSTNVAIGRDPKLAQIVFSDKSVSRLHARIMEKGGQFQLYDEGSASGTYINFEQVGLTPQPLRDNDDVHIGRVHLRFHGAQAVVEDDDSTQVMPGPQARPGAQPVEVDDGLSTQPYLPYQPPSGGQPPAGGQPQRQAPPPAAGEDEDDISTQPYMPHSPRR